MKCRRAKTLIFNFIDGMINDSDRAALEEHLGDCASCEATATGLTKSLDLLHRAPQVQPDENFNWKLRLAIGRERDAATRRTVVQHTWIKAWNTRFAVSAAATFAVVIAAGFFTVGSFDPTDGTTAFVPSEQPLTPVAKVDLPNDDRVRLPSADSGVGTRIVSTANQPQSSQAGSPGLIEEGPVLNVDSLTNRFLQSRRSHLLEEQVDLLQNKLRACEGQQEHP